jgi:phage terminase small subunit
MKDKLTKKQRAFVEEYKTNGGNGTQAAIKAGYSEKTAYSIGSENLSKPEIREALAEHERQMQEKYEYTVDDMVKELNEELVSAKSVGNVSAALKAIELKGKAFGLFVDKVEQNTNITGIKQISVKWK